MRVAVLVGLTLFVAVPLVSQTCPAPTIKAPSAVLASIAYAVRLESDLDPVTFELEESTDAAFSNPTRYTLEDDDRKLVAPRPTIEADTRFYYRVRHVCGNERSAFSGTLSTVVMAVPSQTSSRFDIVIPLNPLPDAVTLNLLVPGLGEAATNNDVFSIDIPASWATVFPQNGALSAGGTTVQVTIDPLPLAFGTTSTTIVIGRNGGTVPQVRIPLSVTLVNSMELAGRPPQAPFGTLIIPAVAHAAGFNSQFRSDVRILNTSDEAQRYDLTFTPAGNDGTTTGKRTTITILNGETVAFDDIVLTAFGSGVLNEPGAGSLEIRPQQQEFAGTLFASSRTFNVNNVGTFGQFVPALDSSDFTSRGTNISLQQIVSNVRYRTNLGFAEGIGAPVEFLVRLFDEDGNLVNTAAQSLRPYEFRQLNIGDSSLFPNLVADDARVEIEVTSETGVVTAYASVLDNDTADPFLVIPTLPENLEPRPRYVVAGIAELNSANNFHSDMRIYNPGTAAQTVTLSYRPQTGDPTPIPTPVNLSIGAGAVSVIDDVLPTLWGLNGTGGAVSVTSTEPLVVTARTFSRNARGTTYGLFIPAVTAEDDSIGAGDDELNILQLEQSANFRTNLGLAETSGTGSVTFSIEGSTGDDSLFNEVTLAPGEFRQIGRIFTDLGFTDDVYNGRIRLQVFEGSGRLSAYGAVVDNRTEDPTYVPAQRE